VTANKALLALHGAEIAKLAEANKTLLGFEASVAGGIPIIKALREGLVGNRVTRLYGILNGTCNYILTTMRETKRDFGDVLAEAQKLGYAEADPSFDIDGIDAAHKLSILAAAAFGAPVNFAGVHVEGIRRIGALDIAFAEELEFRIKLLGVARETEHGVEQRVHPCMVSNKTPIAHVDGVFNAVVVEGDFVGSTMFQGRGAGAGPTASAVVADLVDVARGHGLPPFVVPTAKLSAKPVSPIEKRRGAYYMRLMVLDQPGVIADITAILRDESVSLESMLQHGRSLGPNQPVPVVLVTHETEELAMRRAADTIGKLKTIVEPPNLIRIEDF
jgi:homoserine dehydrogenase